jgi:hypothetical protein
VARDGADRDAGIDELCDKLAPDIAGRARDENRVHVSKDEPTAEKVTECRP